LRGAILDGVLVGCFEIEVRGAISEDGGRGGAVAGPWGPFGKLGPRNCGVQIERAISSKAAPHNSFSEQPTRGALKGPNCHKMQEGSSKSKGSREEGAISEDTGRGAKGTHKTPPPPLALERGRSREGARKEQGRNKETVVREQGPWGRRNGLD